jgi:hypothetical protein
MKQKPLSIVKGNQGRAAALSVGTLRVAAAVKEGETVTIGTTVFEVDTNGSITAGRVAVDLSGSGTAAAAVGTLTLSDNAAADETVVIGDRTYTFKVTAAAANQVKVGADASASIDNLIAAINGAAGAGTLYGTGTVAHALVTAAAGAGDTMVVTAKTKGTAGNAIATTETMGDGAWGAVTLASGADPTAGEFTTAFTAAVNSAGIGIAAVRSTANAVVVWATKIDQIRSSATTETLTGSNNAWGAATLARNLAAEQATGVVVSSRVPSATEVAVESMAFPFSFEPSAVLVQIRTSAGVIKAWDGAVVVSDNLVTLNSSGTTDIAADDVVTVIAQ